MMAADDGSKQASLKQADTHYPAKVNVIEGKSNWLQAEDRLSTAPKGSP